MAHVAADNDGHPVSPDDNTIADHRLELAPSGPGRRMGGRRAVEACAGLQAIRDLRKGLPLSIDEEKADGPDAKKVPSRRALHAFRLALAGVVGQRKAKRPRYGRPLR